jgi:hypothetical protein
MDLETRAGVDLVSRPTFAVMFVEPNGQFGGKRCHCDRASASGGNGVWHREQDETQDDFIQRVMVHVPKGNGPSLSVVIFWPADDPCLGQATPPPYPRV